MEAVMRIRRTILAPVVLAVGTVGALVAAPAIAIAAPAGVATPSTVAYHATPNLMFYP
jgi:hypothetical protein